MGPYGGEQAGFGFDHPDMGPSKAGRYDAPAMGGARLRLTVAQARRLAIRRQHLDAGPRPPRDDAGLLDLVRDLGCLQLDPTPAVARSHLLVVWSRVGRFDPDRLRRLQEEDHALFEHWAHEASLVLSEDLPVFRHRMCLAFTGDGTGPTRIRTWLEDNDSFRRAVLEELGQRGPLRTRDLQAHALRPWLSGGWTNERNVSVLLEVLSARGEVLVSNRRGGVRWWDLAERCLPPGALEAAEVLDEPDYTRRAGLRSLRALGVATSKQIRAHFVRGRYPGLPAVLDGLVAAGSVVPATVEGLTGDWYVAAQDVDLDAPGGGHDGPTRTTLLSPFDNLICDRARAQALWDFRFRLEIYTPAAKRQWGYFVMPVLHGDRLVARADLAVDRKERVLQVKALHWEPGVGRRPGRAVGDALDRLAAFAGATRAVTATATL